MPLMVIRTKKTGNDYVVACFLVQRAALWHTSHQGGVASSGEINSPCIKLRLVQFDATLAAKRGLSATSIFA